MDVLSGYWLKRTVVKKLFDSKEFGLGMVEGSGSKSHEDGRFSRAGESVTQIT
jgi:hypothetical protein